VHATGKTYKIKSKYKKMRNVHRKVIQLVGQASLPHLTIIRKKEIKEIKLKRKT